MQFAQQPLVPHQPQNAVRCRPRYVGRGDEVGGPEDRPGEHPVERAHSVLRAGDFDDPTLPLAIEGDDLLRSEEHTSELQSLMRISYAVFCLKKKNNTITRQTTTKSRKEIIQ